MTRDEWLTVHELMHRPRERAPQPRLSARSATCHPDRDYCARGLCRPCYMTQWYEARKQGATR